MNKLRALYNSFIFVLAAVSARGEAMLQYFNTEWREITRKLPELAEVGYTSMWVPPPTKGSGGLSVGYDLWDRFDLGSKNQRGTVRTLYGTEGDLLEMIETAHRFGIRVYFDNIMNHNAFDVPGFNESTPIDVYPGFVPEDFHLRKTSDGFYRKWDNTRDWNDTWQVQNLGLADLIDIAHESPNTNHGAREGDDIPKITFTRQPDNPEYYLDTDLPQTVSGGGVTVTVYPFSNKEPYQDTGYSNGNLLVGVTTLPGGYKVFNGGGSNVGAGNGRFDFRDLNGNGQHDAGEPCEPFQDTGADPRTPGRNTVGWGFNNNRYDMGNPVPEDVNALLIRSLRWVTDRTKVDGFRLDAVKHVPDYFFGQLSGPNKDRSNAGYLGGAQEQFNLVRGFSDWDNHRDSVFETEIPRDDLMMFGEHLGEPPGYGGYFDSGQRLIDNPLRSELNGRLGNPSSGLQGFDQPGAGGFAPGLGVTHAQSHDSDFAARRELQHAYYFTRAGLPLIYTDGYNKAGILQGSGGAFPRHSNTNFLGQFNDPRIPNVVYLHNHFARGSQVGRWSDSDYVAYERIDKRENPSMTDADGVVMLFMMNDNFSAGQARNLQTAFPRQAGTSNDAYLFNYSTYGGGFYTYASNLGSVVVPPGGYFAFSWRSPEEADGWRDAGGKPLMIFQNGQQAGSVSVVRRDGRDGDPAFNPYGLPDTNQTDFSYTTTVPRVTNGTNLSFVTRADASAENILLTLDGGVNINSQMGLGPTTGDLRDNPPALRTDVFLGYEQPQFIQRTYGEKFAAVDTLRSKFGSAGAETYIKTIGSGSVSVVNGPANANDFSTDGGANASFLFHNPSANVAGIPSPPLQYVENAGDVTIWAKANQTPGGYRMRLYYTTDGSNPEGAAGFSLGTTKVVTMNFQHAEGGANAGNWWRGTIIPKPTGQLRYKIGIYRQTDGANALGSIFPSGPAEVARKKRGMTAFQITNFNATTVSYRPHNDYSEERVGLSEGFHMLRARAFLNRSGRASIYNTWTQPFYYDTETPQGEIRFPATNGETIGGSSYGAVIRTNSDVTEVWYHISDGDTTNDDAVTGTQGGNGSGPEPFTDANGNGTRDAAEPFVDIDGDGVFDANLPAAWQRASEVNASQAIASAFPKEWRFTYRNIPSSGSATIKVRLLELSSTRNMTLTPANAWVTELTRTVNTAGPNLRMFVAFPQQDGQVVGEGYVMKVRFTNTLGDGVNESELRSRFVVKIASQVSGDPTGAVVQAPQALPIIYNASAGFHDFQFALPNLYNGRPDFLHTIEVTMNRPGNAPLVATRLVKAFPVDPGPFISIINPPEFDSDGKRYEIVLPDVPNPTPEQRQMVVEVDSDPEVIGVQMIFTRGSGTMTLINDGTPNPRIEGSNKFWRFLWSGMSPGEFTFEARGDTDGNPTTAEAVDRRNATVIFRQIVPSVSGDTDDDDDGLSDAGEQTITALPTTSPDNWTNGQVHVSFAFGQTSPTLVDTDGDGLHDGLEVGWASASDPGTNTTTDTNGDGFPNFLPDLDAPLFNVLGNATRPPGYNLFEPWPYDYNRARTDQLAGTTTNPNRPDTDDDSLFDGIEDNNRNGRVEIATLDGNGNITSLIAHPPTVYNTSRIDRTKLPVGAQMLETDPNSNDTDADGLRDGSEDSDGSGAVTLVVVDRNVLNGLGDFLVLGPLDESNALGFGKFSDITYSQGTYKSRRISPQKLAAAFPRTNPANGHQIDVLWRETDPCNADTDKDGLPDGWEQQYGFDPLDPGTGLSLRSGKPGLPINGPAGDPDNDTFSNLAEFVNGTDPRTPDTGVPPPPNTIVIGPQPPVTLGAVVNTREFTDWSADSLIVLDEQDGEGPNNSGSDVYHANDGGDSSRDLVAFYAQDGGAPAAGGDGNFYFRVDMADLRPLAEDGRLDIYVVINFGNAGAGERNLPDDVDTLTTMGWQAVVACYSGNNGRVYLDTNPAINTTTIGQSFAGTGVIFRDQNTANGFKSAYFNSELDSVEFSISRQALLDAGWNGLDASDLTYQVFTTKDGTTNNPVGAGDLGGRTDIRDTIYDDFLASDYFGDQSAIRGSNSRLQAYFGLKVSNDRGRSVKVMPLVHGNQHNQPGSNVQSLINNAQGAGYYRPLDVHEAFSVPLNLHITPTLATSIQWASADAASPRQYRDGPAFNQRIRKLANDGVLHLLGSTFSDHIVDYFPADFNTANVSLAREYLTHFYGPTVSTLTFWNPERVFDSDVFGKISALGFSYTFIDQQRHVFKWFGRQSSLSNEGYRINQINGLRCFVINDNLNGVLFANEDVGVPNALRRIILRKARSSEQDQVIVLFHNWEDFSAKNRADAYDANIRWLANRPWVRIVTPEQIATGQIDLNVPPDGVGNAWGTVNRGTGLGLVRVQHDFVDFATQENYDNWYFGQPGREEGLRDKRFNIRPGVQLPTAKKFGTIGIDGISQETWMALSAMSPVGSPLQKLGRGGAFASVFQTAFHNQTSFNLSKYSTGAYIFPDTSNQTLADFATVSQAQIRHAAVLARVSTWVAQANAGVLNGVVTAETSDPDLDGENEYLLFNDRLFALFERIGGRLVGAWARDPATGATVQMIGNPLAYAGLADEREGETNMASGAVNAYRVTAMRDQFVPTVGGGTTQYVNNLYTVTAAPSGTGWRLTSSDGVVVKTVTLTPGSGALLVSHGPNNGSGIHYVRFGLNPDLGDLLLNGQVNLQTGSTAPGNFYVFNKRNSQPSRIAIIGSGTTFLHNAAAADREAGTAWDTVNMRNLAQTVQAEFQIQPSTLAAYQIRLETGSGITGDSDGDLLPDLWEIANNLDPLSNAGIHGALGDADGDGRNNRTEYVFLTNPTTPDAANSSVTITQSTASTRTLTFRSQLGRSYRVQYTNDLSQPWQQAGGDIPGTGSLLQWTDDGSQTGSAPSVATQRYYRIVGVAP